MNRADLEAFDLPDNPGVYFFLGAKREILYIGKATSLRDRVRSYFSSQLANARSGAIAKMVEEATSVVHTETGSVLEALILEANLIKKHQPPYNTDQKDNKSYNYVIVTKEEFPRVLLVRGRDLFQKSESTPTKYIFGPFPHGGQIKEALKIIRKIFPYRDTCAIAGKPCFNRQLGLCPGGCSGEMSRSEYARTIQNIKTLFSGNFMGLKRRLASGMRKAAAAERFEEAGRLRKQVAALEHIRDVSLIKDERVSAGGGARIEAYDIAHTAGAETVGVMVVISNGEAIKGAYRKFKIQTVSNNDVAALKEILTRRLNHPEWPLPRVFVVDGGLAQMRAAQKVTKQVGMEIPIVGVVKNAAHKPERLIGDQRAIEAYEKDILLANSEAHRYAIQFHRKRRAKSLV